VAAAIRVCCSTTGCPARDLPASATVDVTHHPVGNALKRRSAPRLNIPTAWWTIRGWWFLNAVDAAERGAVIRTGARCVRAERLDTWRLVTIDRGHRQVITARRWPTPPAPGPRRLRKPYCGCRRQHVGTAQIGQIIVRRLFDTDSVYVFQNIDRRLIFASPYQRDFTLIGTVGHTFKGDPSAVSMPAGDVVYLCDAANRYFRERVEPSDVIRTLSGANMVVDPASRRGARDGSMAVDVRRGKAPLLTIFGGGVTTSRLARGTGRLRAYAFLSDVAALDSETSSCREAILHGPGSRQRSIMPASAGGF